MASDLRVWRTRAAVAQRLACLALLASACSARATAGSGDPLPSWNDGAAKRAIVAFVTRVTTLGHPDFIPIPDRVATFDNDGTLWPEKPVVQGAFVLSVLKEKVAEDPSLASRPAIKAALAGDLASFTEAGEQAITEILAITTANSTQEQYESEVRAFFDSAKHPKLGVPYTALGYRPMTEVLSFLRANGFVTFVCSGGGADFMRVVSERMYGVLPQQVIGSRIEKQLVRRDGKAALWRLPQIEVINDKDTKPLNIDAQIGKRPVFAAGNVRSGGDIGMLEYSDGSPQRSLQLMVNHDDAAREFAYQEKDGASLAAAREHGWTVVSIKRDWKTIFR
jgi:hypothetical protein